MTDETTPQDSAAMSPASAGSQPVAWAVFEADGHCIGTYSKQEHARIVMEELAYDGMVYEPLYRQPGPSLTDAEREAIGMKATFTEDGNGIEFVVEGKGRHVFRHSFLITSGGRESLEAESKEINRLKLTRYERHCIKRVRNTYADEDDVACNEIAAVFDGLLERTK